MVLSSVSMHKLLNPVATENNSAPANQPIPLTLRNQSSIQVVHKSVVKYRLKNQLSE